MSMLPYSEACERNKEVILNVFQQHIKGTKRVLEIGSGTAQHAVHFAKNLLNITWQTSDQASYLPGIKARLQQATLSNLMLPIELDVMQKNWFQDLPNQDKLFDVVFTANTLHIMSWQQVQAMFANILSVLSNQGMLIIYGPFKYQNAFTSDSNQRFDAMLRQGDSLSGIRDFEVVNQLAQQQGLTLTQDISMPANNQCLIWYAR